MAASFTIPSLHKSHFLGSNRPHTSSSPIPKTPSIFNLKPRAKFDLFEIMGGRGLCNGEQGLQQLLNKNIEQPSPPPPMSPSVPTENQEKSATSTAGNVPENAFEKELLGLTGGFPGGEKGLQKFIETNPPPIKSEAVELMSQSSAKKPKPPQLPLLMPGMIAIVKNPNNPFYMYCGIIQRITDGKAGVLFEGGNWDRLVTFRLDELQRREKGPPMVNPRSAALEPLLENES